jgi:RNA polymerase sigma-70 factor (ECF subfamily)
MHTTPASLLQQLQQSPEEQGWAQFVRLYTPLLLYWARKLGLREDEAADLVQEVFVVLVRKLPEFHYKPGGSFRAWLKTIAVNKWRDRVRGPRRPQQFDDDLPLAVPGDAMAEAVLFDEAEYRRRLVARAMELMRKDFKPVTWQAFWEHGVEGRPAADVAAELRLSIGAVYSAKFRVLDRLRRELNGLLDVD